MIRAWWNKLIPSEQRMVAAGAIAAAFLLGWALIWHPLATRRAELRQSVEAQRHELAYVRVAAAEVERLRAAGTHSRADRQGRSLLALADATARAAGLEAALKRVEPVGAASVRVSFEFAGFDPLIGWIEGMARDYGVETTDFSADRADGVGLVNARVTLQDAP